MKSEYYGDQLVLLLLNQFLKGPHSNIQWNRKSTAERELTEQKAK